MMSCPHTGTSMRGADGSLLALLELGQYVYEEISSKKKLERGEYIDFSSEAEFREAVLCGCVKPSDVKRVRYPKY